MTIPVQTFDVIVVGKGNAALCAAISAREQGVRVAVLEAAPEEEAGGNSRFSGGVLRFAYDSVEDLKKIIEIPDDEARNTDWDTNTTDQFFDDMFRVTRFRTDPQLSEVLVTKSREILLWLRSHGVRFVPNYDRQSAVVNGRRTFFGRSPLEVYSGGAGLVKFLDEAAQKAGIEIFYETRAVSLIYDGERVLGIRAKNRGKAIEFQAPSVVLACGGFEANPEWRTRYLGPGWELAKVRGTRFNMGEGLRMALDIGACPYGNWSGRHATLWDREAPEFGDPARRCARLSFPLSIMVNAEGRRFLDEGLDFYGYTYATYGDAVLKQTAQFAWQVFDAKVKQFMQQHYREKYATKVTADTVEALAAKLEGVDPQGFLKTVRDFNAAVRTDVAFNPSIKDGRGTIGIEPQKSNWANALDTPPFEAYAITCGITFTYGGLRIDHASGQVLDVNFHKIPGLYCAGEMVGGLFYFNYPSSSGLTSGAIFGRIAGASAARAAKA